MEIEAPTLSSPSSVHKAGITAWTWTYTLSYNKLILLNGKMNGEEHHCQNASSLPNPNLPVADMPLLESYRSPEQHLPSPHHCEVLATLPVCLLATLRPTILPWVFPITTYLYFPTVLLPVWLFFPSPLCFSSYHFSILQFSASF